MRKNNFILRIFFTMMGFLLAVSINAQVTITGTVTDKSGEPIIGANVLVKGTTNGTITDIEGAYKIKNVPSTATLSFSYIGYSKKDILVNGKREINVELYEDNKVLDDVIVVGYAIGSKRTISGAVNNVGKADMNVGSLSGAADALKGKVAGVYISKSGGDPNGAVNIRVRGTSSLSGGNDPLVIIDGVYSDMSTFNTLAPSDIENVTILKDASETAQYGSRGASGVLVVTTTKGKAGRSKISYSGQFGINNVFKNIDVLSAGEYVNACKKLGVACTDFKNNTDWMDFIERNNGITQNHNLSFISGNEFSNVRASVGVIQQQGAIKNSDMTNYTGKFDLTQFSFNKKLKAEFGIIASEKVGKNIYDMQKTMFSAAAYNPTYSTNYTNREAIDGTGEDTSASEIYNPAGMLNIDDKTDLMSLTTHARLTYSILPSLKLMGFGSYVFNDLTNKVYLPYDVQEGFLEGGGHAQISNQRNKNYMGNLQLNFNKDFDKHHIDALALVEAQKYTYFEWSTNARGFQTNYFKYNNLRAGANVSWGDNRSTSREYTLMSYMGRLNYVYNDKYILTANVRYDGSSKLGSGNKWGVFPSASVAWVLSNEEFIKDITWINNIKLRAGVGVTGNQDVINPYNSLSLMEPNGVVLYNQSNTTSFGITSNSNPELKWEKKTTYDVGADLSLFNNRLNMIVDYYHSKTTNLLYNYTVPVPPFTYTNLLANIGSMTNDGLELSLDADIIKTKDFTFNTNVNLAFQKNKLVSLSGTYNGEQLSTSEHIPIAHINGPGCTHNNNVTYLIEGQPIGTFYLPHCTGISEDGKYIIEDLNKDGNLDLSDDGDRKVCGSAIPKTYLGVGFNFRYKNWDLSTHFNGAFGHKIFNGTGLQMSNLSLISQYNVLSSALDKNINEATICDYWIEKGDYVNFEYASLGYTLPNKVLKSLKYLSDFHIAFSVNNIATITGYKGLTPMINSSSLVQQAEGLSDIGTLGVDDKRIYPLSRTYSLSLSVSF